MYNPAIGPDVKTRMGLPLDLAAPGVVAEDKLHGFSEFSRPETKRPANYKTKQPHVC